jgi:hypothetical protein
VRSRIIFSRVLVVACVIRRGFDRMIGFTDTLYAQLRITGNIAVSLIYTLYSSTLHTHYCSHSSLVVSGNGFITVSR